jgi:glutamine---fructose-6-phosphate transaminase (isomerizing)
MFPGPLTLPAQVAYRPMLGRFMEEEIRDQPRALAANAARYEDELRGFVRDREFDMALLVARGSSDHAALYGRYLIEIHLGLPVSLAAPSVLTRYGRKVRYRRCLAVGLSQSGAAPDVAEVLAMMREGGHATVAITNTPGSRVTEAAEHSLVLDVGEERSVAATKTYTASLLAMYQLVRACGAELPSAIGALPDQIWLERARREAESGLGYVLRSLVLFALARGYGFCTAQESALKLMECALLACKSYSTADFQHGPKALAGPGSAAIVYGAAQDDPDLAALEGQGCQVVRSCRTPEDLPPPLTPIWDIFFGQWLALGAARARAFDPDKPQFIQKVTETR